MGVPENALARLEATIVGPRNFANWMVSVALLKVTRPLDLVSLRGNWTITFTDKGDDDGRRTINLDVTIPGIPQLAAECHPAQDEDGLWASGDCLIRFIDDQDKAWIFNCRLVDGTMQAQLAPPSQPTIPNRTEG